ncbi:hypothetical protein [Pseudoruegeria sp. HB172150]|uniref:hypothetical protein n=1 Tax=Pseudoruegeria sp. HB172150 TaxID=2721164 RepID=UPI001551E3A9|nr:hypothetical protein [Pseudoruegeria sp. HB172150]
MFRTTVTAFALLASPALAQDNLVSDTRSADDFAAAFCAADRSNQHVFILPMELFRDGGEVTCDDGVSTLRMSEPEHDPGHAEVAVDSPEGVEDAFDCDGKADLGMTLIAINCLPVNLETASHH